MFKKKCKIILIRHGSTIYTEQDRLYDGEDYPPLNQQGKKEMEILTNWLSQKTLQVDEIFTSSSLRSIQSARIIAKEYDMDYKIIDGLHERKAGLWAGLTFEQIEEKYPEMLEKYHENPYDYWPEGGESTHDVRMRVEKTINELVDKYENKTIVLVTHKSVIQAAIASCLQISEERQGRVKIPTGSATQINYFDGWETISYCSYVPNI